MSTSASVSFEQGIPTSHPISLQRAYHRHRDQAYVSSLFALLALLGDAACISAALLAGFYLRFFTDILPVLGGYETYTQGFQAYAGVMAFGGITLLLLLLSRNAYALPGLTRPSAALRSVANAVLTWAVAFLALALILRLGPGISRMFVVFSTVLALGLLIGWRCLLTYLIRNSAAAEILGHRVLVVGWNEQAARLYQALRIDTATDYRIVGCIPSANHPFESNPPDEVRRFNSFDQFEDIIRRYGVDLVIGAEIDTNKESFGRLASICERQMISFKAIPSNFRVLLSGLSTDFIGGVPLLGVDQLPLANPLNRIVKRAFDIVVGSIGLVLSAPIIAVFAYLVYRESPGPVFYRQVRTGRHGRLFEIIKIRSMRLDAEVEGQAGWTREDDPRRLKIGSLMRKLNVDELPQFWNVLHGEMTLVGPRPERPELIEKFKSDTPPYNARHYVKPGITGWAQVNGWRGDTDLTQRVLCDLHYMENWSLWFDIAILFRTFRAGKNAY